MSEEMKPCPLCRGEAVEETGEAHTHHFATFMPDSPGYTMISCPACGCAIIRETQAEARQVWNTRTPPPGYVIVPESFIREVKSVLTQLDRDCIHQNDYGARTAIGSILSQSAMLTAARAGEE